MVDVIVALAPPIIMVVFIVAVARAVMRATDGRRPDGPRSVPRPAPPGTGTTPSGAGEPPAAADPGPHS